MFWGYQNTYAIFQRSSTQINYFRIINYFTRLLNMAHKICTGLEKGDFQVKCMTYSSYIYQAELVFN